jgi:dienelactone hydrolase
MKIRERFSILQASVLCLLILLVTSGTLWGDTPPMWRDLQPGPYTIGFRTIEKYDHSRAFAPKRDYFGQPLPGERARPMQTCIWYPAQATDAAQMVYGEYSFPYPEQQDFFAFAANIQGRDIQVLTRALQTDQGTIQELMNTPMAAVRDATPQEGTFPLILYHPNLLGTYCENAVLCEYLASHGYVVATTHPLGLTELSPAPEVKGLETAVRDLEFALATMHDFAEADLDHIGLLGYAQGGSTALLMQMHNTDVDAVACLNASFCGDPYVEIVKQSPSYDADLAQRPILQIYRSVDPTSCTATVSSLKYSDRHLVGVTGPRPGHFCSLSRMLGPQDGADQYAAISGYVLDFFDGYLKGDEEALILLDRKPAGDEGTLLTHIPAEQAPPNQRQFLSIILEKGVDTALSIYERFKSGSAPGSFFTEATINALGYGRLQTGDVDGAVKLFKLNTEAFPQSANTWDSLGDAYLAMQDYENALKCARKTLEMIDGDTGIDPTFKDQIRRSAEHKVQEIETQNGEQP